MPRTHRRHSRPTALLLLASALTAPAALAQGAGEVTTNWFRMPAISPDGQQIVFCHGGDLYIVPVGGGRAMPLTIHEAYESAPVWSHDGKHIAFASDRNGNNDVYIMPAEGGPATRLTFHSAGDTPTEFTHDNAAVLFNSSRVDHAEAALFPSNALNELYSVPVTGGTPTMMLTTANELGQSTRDDSRIVYQDRKGFEDPLRKHHRSSITRDIWIVDLDTGEHTKLTDFEGEDRDPSWSRNERSIFFLSERAGDSNIFKMAARPGADATQLTDFEHHPVRDLSVSDNETMAFSWHGDIYTMREGREPQRLDIRIGVDGRQSEPLATTMRGGATEFDVAPSGKEVAFIVRGEVFVTSTDFGTTRRITNTPEQERSVSFAPDGRTLVYASERDGSWNLYESAIADDDELYFFSATKIEESVLLATDDDEFQPRYAPDGESVAYLHERSELRVMDAETGGIVTAMPGDMFYSYADGDMWYEWSPDSAWLAVHFYDKGRVFYPEVALMKADGSGERINLSESGYDDNSPRFGMEGGAVVWATDRYGERSHGSWGAEYDVIGAFLTQDAFDRYRLSEEEYTLRKELEEKQKEDAADADAEEAAEDEPADENNGEPAEAEAGADEATDEEADLLEIEADGIETRRVRMTIHASDLADFALDPKGTKLYYLASFEGGYNLWVHDMREESTRILTRLDAGSASMTLSDDGGTIFMLANGALAKIDTASGSRTPIGFSATMHIDSAAEREHLLEHVWRQTKKKFYRPDMHGVDWPFYLEQYRPKLQGITNNDDFATILSEMLGELNASHTGGFSFGGGGPGSSSTAVLGVIYDQDYRGEGRKIAEILENGPLDRAELGIEAGDIVLAVDGVTVDASTNYYAQFDGKAGDRVRLTIRSAGGEESDKIVRPISSGAQNNLLYERWTRTRNALVEELSGGRLGYAHVRGMNDASFRAFYQDVMGKHFDKEALIVDTRFNGGGWLHDDLATFLTGETYVNLYPRNDLAPGISYHGDPATRWTKPSIVVMSESNYSDAHFFPWVYTELGIGDTVGMPVPGTATAVWWETLFTGDLVFGIPQVGTKGKDGVYLENNQLEPTHLINLDPESAAAGDDTQIRKAVEVLLEQLDG